MTVPPLVIEHDLDAPAAVAWDALVDPDLVSGWLGEARIDARAGGEFRLAWMGAVGGPALDGEIAEFDAARRLTVSSEDGRLCFELESREGGLRGTWTLLRLTAAPDDTPSRGVAARALTEQEWRAALGQLDELLRGHPVDWYGGRAAASALPRRGADSG